MPFQGTLPSKIMPPLVDLFCLSLLYMSGQGPQAASAASSLTIPSSPPLLALCPILALSPCLCFGKVAAFSFLLPLPPPHPSQTSHCSSDEILKNENSPSFQKHFPLADRRGKEERKKRKEEKEGRKRAWKEGRVGRGRGREEAWHFGGGRGGVGEKREKQGG